MQQLLTTWCRVFESKISSSTDLLLTADDVDAALGSIQALLTQGRLSAATDRELVASSLTKLESCAPDSLFNAKLRRKLRRLVQSLQTDPLDIAGAVAKQLLSSNNELEVVAVLNGIDMTNIDAGAGSRQALCSALEILLSPDRLATCNLSRAIRRRISRLLFVLNPQLRPSEKKKVNATSLGKDSTIDLSSRRDIPSKGAQGSYALVAQEVTPLDSAAKPLLECLTLLRAAKNAEDVEEALRDITARSITSEPSTSTVLSETEKELASILEEGSNVGTAKLKRKLRRLLEMMRGGVDEPKTSSSVPSSGKAPILNTAPESEAKRARTSKSIATLASEETEEVGKEKEEVSSVPGNFPYVVFVGQLSFTTTKQDIEQHFRSGGVGGPISVRLLTNKGSGSSRGMAFVQIEGSKELRNALALHHSTLENRRINIEQSAGGGKRKRSEEIAAKRSDRQEPRLKLMRAPPPLLRPISSAEEKGDISITTHTSHNYDTPSFRSSSSNRGRHSAGRGRGFSRVGRVGGLISERHNDDDSEFDSNSYQKQRQSHDVGAVPSLENVFRSTTSRGRGRSAGRGRGGARLGGPF